MVQAKRYKGYVGTRAVQEVIGGMRYYHCENGMVITISYYSNNARELAKRSIVILWDRNDLLTYFKVEKNTK